MPFPSKIAATGSYRAAIRRIGGKVIVKRENYWISTPLMLDEAGLATRAESTPAMDVCTTPSHPKAFSFGCSSRTQSSIEAPTAKSFLLINDQRPTQLSAKRGHAHQ